MKGINLLYSGWGSTLLQNLNSLRGDGKLCDVKLVLQGGTVMSVHSSVMAAASPFFKSILDGADNPELNMEDFPKETIEQVLSFIYTGVVDISESDLYMLYTVAVDLNIQMLQDMVKEVMQRLDHSVGDADGAEQSDKCRGDAQCLAGDDKSELTDRKQLITEVTHLSHELSEHRPEQKSDPSTTQSNTTQKYPAYIKEDGDEEFVMFNDSENFGSCQKVIEIKQENNSETKRRRGRPRRNRDMEKHGVVIKVSEVSPSQKGVFTKTPFPKSVSFGPYNTWNKEKDKLKNKCSFNWMKLVQFAPTEKQHNLEAYESSGYVFFRTTTDIKADVELLLWCSVEDRERLGITEPNSNDEELAGHSSDTIYLPIGQVYEPPERRFDCTKCGMAFISEVAFHKHMRQKHDKPLPLEIYLKIEKEKQAKKAAKTEGSDVAEEKSNALIQNSLSLQRRERPRGRDTKRPYVCSVCGKTFAKTVTLKQHSVIHSKERPFKCKVCGKGFTQTGNLSTHMMIHTGEKPFRCDKCGKGFAEASNFRRHWRTHTGDKPYLCFTCGRRFSQFCHLKSHTLKHTGERPYKCNICSKSFCEKSSLAVHMKRHGEKIYLCPFCNKTFYTSCELITHKKINHVA